MAKVSIKSERITPFGAIFQVREEFSRFVGPVIDKVLGLRCTSFGYQYSEIAGSLASVYFCGGDCVEDVTSHLMNELARGVDADGEEIVVVAGREGGKPVNDNLFALHDLFVDFLNEERQYELHFGS